MDNLETKYTIMVIDDEPTIVKALSDKLIREGFDVVPAGDGEEGLEKAFEHKPALILLDILMPKMDGLTMLKRLREDSWGQFVPVIILSSLDSDEKVTEAMAGSVYDYLVKKETDISDIMLIVKEKLKI